MIVQDGSAEKGERASAFRSFSLLPLTVDSSDIILMEVSENENGGNTRPHES